MKKLIKEIERRQEKIRKHLVKEKLDGFLITIPYNIFYGLNFYFVPTERPVVALVDREGAVSLAVPALEEDEARKLNSVKKIITYFEYPGQEDLFTWIMEEFKRGNPGLTRIAIDTASYGKYNLLSGIFTRVVVDNYIQQLREVKSAVEIDFLKTAAHYADFIVEYGASLAKPGLSELDLLTGMQGETTARMVEELDTLIYVPGGPCGGLVPGGERTALPHALPSARKIKEGDNLILSCGANYRGYRVECERTFFVGEVSDRKAEIFAVMREAQELGISLMKPGNSCSNIDKEVLGFIEDAGYRQYIKHRTGHGKGLEEHEPPWVERGDQTILKPGMVLSSEPGIYLEGFAGFRHSDTVVVREGEPLVLTNHSKDLSDMILD